MAYKDLREFLSRLEAENELIRIDREVSPEPDVGALGRAAADLEQHEGKGTAVFCEKVQGYNIPLVFGVHASPRRVALALGLSKEIDSFGLFKELSKIYDKYPIAPEEITKKSLAPCKQVIKVGKEVDLTIFPIVRWNTADGGPFITKGNVISKDASGVVNIGFYRLQLKGPNRLGVPLVPSHDIGRQAREARLLRKDTLEVVIAIGNDPVLPLAAVSPVPEDWSEYGLAGAMRGQPLQVVRAETVNLPVPANSEIIIEGYVDLSSAEVEGPFAEFPGYYSHIRRAPEIKVTAITHKENPIFENLYIGKPLTEGDYISQIPNSVAVYKQAKLLAPELKAFNLASTWCMVGVASMTKSYGGQDKKVMNAVLASRHAAFGLKVLFIVDDDIDPFNLDDVFWALSSRFDPDKDIVYIPNATRNNLDPTIPGKGYGGKLVLDLTSPKPPEPTPAFSVVGSPPLTEEWKRTLKDLMVPATKGSGPGLEGKKVERLLEKVIRP